MNRMAAATSNSGPAVGGGGATESKNNREALFSKHGINRAILEYAYSKPAFDKWSGPICDTVGFRQHGGECWSDTLQQVLFFADGLKEHTQEYFYKTPFGTIATAIDALPSEDLDPEQKIKVKEYARAAQRRFINHYNFIKTGDAIFDVCVESPVAAVGGEGSAAASISNAPSSRTELKRRHSLIFSTNAARSIVGYKKETSGGEISHHLLDTLIFIASGHHISYTLTFQVPIRFHKESIGKIFMPKVDTKSRNSNMAIFLKTLVFNGPLKIIDDSTKSEPEKPEPEESEESEESEELDESEESNYMLISSSGRRPFHECGIYRCDGILYFYDDNTGVTPIEMDLNFLHAYNIVLQFKSKESNNVEGIVFCNGIPNYYLKKKVGTIERYVNFLDDNLKIKIYNHAKPLEPIEQTMKELVETATGADLRILTFSIIEFHVCDLLPTGLAEPEKERRRRQTRRNRKVRKTRRRNHS